MPPGISDGGTASPTAARCRLLPAPNAGSASSFTSHDSGSQNDERGSCVIGCTLTSRDARLPELIGRPLDGLRAGREAGDASPFCPLPISFVAPALFREPDDGVEVGAQSRGVELRTGRSVGWNAYRPRRAVPNEHCGLRANRRGKRQSEPRSVPVRRARRSSGSSWAEAISPPANSPAEITIRSAARQRTVRGADAAETRQGSYAHPNRRQVCLRRMSETANPTVVINSLLLPTSGPVAQLGARMNGIHEVTGSIPVRSTILSVRLSTHNSHCITAASWQCADALTVVSL